MGNIGRILLTWLRCNKDDLISRDRHWSQGAISPIYAGQHDRETNYHSVNSTVLTPGARSLYISSTLLLPSSPDSCVNSIESVHELSRRLETKPRMKKKGTVEIISGRDRRLQGEGEKTGPRLQRDRSGVSEMEPLPATQNALRLELRSAKEPGSTPPSPSFVCPASLWRRDSGNDDGRFSRSSSPSSPSSSSPSPSPSSLSLRFWPSHWLHAAREALSPSIPNSRVTATEPWKFFPPSLRSTRETTGEYLSFYWQYR